MHSNICNLTSSSVAKLGDEMQKKKKKPGRQKAKMIQNDMRPKILNDCNKDLYCTCSFEVHSMRTV